MKDRRFIYVNSIVRPLLLGPIPAPALIQFLGRNGSPGAVTARLSLR
jgi:hypothetical protein